MGPFIFAGVTHEVNTRYLTLFTHGIAWVGRPLNKLHQQRL